MIRPAVIEDLPHIAAIYDAIFDQEERGPVYTNWKRGSYPTADDARKAIEVGTLYAGEDDAGFIWGVVNFNGIQLPEYAAIPWSIPADPEQVGVIHTLCIHPAQSGKGYARRTVAFCEDLGRAQGKTVIRLDTWEHNLPANRLYPSLGYRFAGATEFFFHGFVRENLNCYEKKLCQRQIEIVRKRRRNFVVFRRWGNKISCFLAQKECSQFAVSGA
ncbi:MAG: GNAT family N-acetyltransferase [Oscillibacter sp.]|nr:GNAT family N-acetyltransferase [Oscillibacter sp.]